MLRAFIYTVLFALTGLAVWWAVGNIPGSVLVTISESTSIEASLVVAGLLLLLAGAVIALFWSTIIGLWNLPSRMHQSRLKGREKKANTALVDGLLAAEGGDAQLAKRLAHKAKSHAADERLVLLLEARAAEEAENWAEAERAWSDLRRMSGGELAALKGLAAAALERGDSAIAEIRNREAMALKTNANWPFHALFDLQVAKGAWSAALDTLMQGERRGLVQGDVLSRRRAVLLTALAVETGRTDAHGAQRILADAIRSAPGFPPAAWHGARHLLNAGKHKAAQNILQLSWKARPHPSLARLARFGNGDIGDATSGRARAEALIENRPEHRESRILAAELAMEAGNWPDALKHLAGVLEMERPTSRLCLLMARALEGYGQFEEAGRWHRSAAHAGHELDWSDLDAKGSAFTYDTQDWSRLVYEFGDAARMIHPRHEKGGRLLEPVPETARLPAPDADGGSLEPIAPRTPRPPIDYAVES